MHDSRSTTTHSDQSPVNTHHITSLSGCPCLSTEEDKRTTTQTDEQTASACELVRCDYTYNVAENSVNKMQWYDADTGTDLATTFSLRCLSSKHIPSTALIHRPFPGFPAFLLTSILKVCGTRWKCRKPNRTNPKIQKAKTRFPWFGFQKKQLRRFVDGFSRCLIHNSSCSMIGSTVNVFFFMPYLCTSSSESLRLTISWTNSACLASYLRGINERWRRRRQTNVGPCRPNRTDKTETAVNYVKPKLNRKPQFFANRTENRTEVIFCQPHTPSPFSGVPPPNPAKLSESAVSFALL